MSKVVIDDIEKTEEYVHFIEQLKTFHSSKGTTLLSEPVLGGKKIDLYKLYQEVVKAGGFDQVTKKRSWKQIGDIFEFPSTCTNSAYILKGLYIRNLLGWEEEQIWRKEWVPPQELKGPEAHKASTLAGKTYKKNKPKPHPYVPNINHEPFILPKSVHVASPYSSPYNLPFSLITTNKIHQCEISERHHITQPIEHIHSVETEADVDCVEGSKFDEQAKKTVMNALQSSKQDEVEWALNHIVTISYESPHKLLIPENPILLHRLLQIAHTCLQHALFHPADHASHTSLLKILHIIRNFSFIQTNTQVFVSNGDFKQMLIKSLVIENSSHYSHCIDILENITPRIELEPFDSIIGCLNNLLQHATDRSVILGSIRILTKLAITTTSNLHYLLPTAHQTMIRITQFLMANDEELTGLSLEYLYHYSHRSVSFGQDLLMLHAGADLAILVSLLMSPCRYFQSTLDPVQRDSPDVFLEHEHGHLPCVPNLTAYPQLDEPYRCLGWLKDKFELSNGSSELSLDDIYLLYELRFGQEKALHIKNFYTVLKIAFPIASPSFEGSPTQGAIMEGTTVRGLQAKMCIIQEGADLTCQWTNCSSRFNDEQKLQNHVLHDHIHQEQTNTNCMWTDCDLPTEFQNPNELSTHIKDSHLMGYVDHSEIEGVALVAAKLLTVLSKNPNSHRYFMPYEQELNMILKRRPKLTPYIESIFSNFNVTCSNDCSFISLDF